MITLCQGQKCRGYFLLVSSLWQPCTALRALRGWSHEVLAAPHWLGRNRSCPADENKVRQLSREPLKKDQHNHDEEHEKTSPLKASCTRPKGPKEGLKEPSPRANPGPPPKATKQNEENRPSETRICSIHSSKNFPGLKSLDFSLTPPERERNVVLKAQVSPKFCNYQLLTNNNNIIIIIIINNNNNQTGQSLAGLIVSIQE